MWAMSSNLIPDSFSIDDDVVVDGPVGQRVHRDLLAHTDRLERRMWTVRPGVWCLVGNGLSNQTFVEGPDGVIVIDTGESVEEMRSALAELREHTQAPIVAVIYTHFHYVAGTTALYDDGAADDIEVWGHEGIVGNRTRMGFDMAAAAGRGIVHQFGMSLPDDGPDAVVNVGLGLWWRNNDNAPFTSGFVAPTVTFNSETSATIAGLKVELTPAPSDADDSATIWFPELGVCVNNLVWPTLFNVFAIRGEEYRDPRILIRGLDHIVGLEPEHLVGAHGPPISGAERIHNEVTDYADSIRYLWDQSVRGINRGLTVDELIHAVQLPDRFRGSYFTQQYYGLAEHHVRQIHNGLRGWFDGDEATLLRLPPAERCSRLIEGFGGPDEVRAQVRSAMADKDFRWALELGSWLVRCEVDDKGRADGGTTDDRALLASVLREIGQRTTASNVRSWCHTRARELEGTLDIERLRSHRFAKKAVLGNPVEGSVHGLRVLVDPAKAAGLNDEVRWEFATGERVGLQLRDQVAIPTDGSQARLAIALDLATWADVVSGKSALGDALDSGAISAAGSIEDLRAFFACFDHPTLS